MDNIYIIHTNKPLGKISKWILRKIGCRIKLGGIIMDNTYIIHTNKPLGKIRKWILRKIECRFVGDNQV